jgi:membrane protein YqaA with SNARE-associated domain
VTQDQPAPVAARRPGLYRRFYNWVLHWAYTPYAQPALFVMSFAESSFFPIPPDVLLIPMCLGNRLKALWFAFLCSLASVLGGMFGYYLGMTFWEAGLREFCFTYVFSEEKFDKVAHLYGEYAFVAVFAAGFSPLPYKVFTIAAGVCHAQVDFGMFVLASAVSRSARFYLEAALLRIWGAQIKDFIDRRLGLVSLVFCVCLVGGFYLIKVVL